MTSTQATSPPLQSHRAGNYILTIGRPGSGKTTFQNFMIRYLLQGNSSFALEPLGIDGKPASNVLVSTWRKEWEEGKFSPATPLGEPKEYAFRATPIGQYKGKPELEFGFFEVSGEELVRVVIENVTDQPTIPDTLKAFLRNPKVNFVIVFVCAGDRPGQDDQMFSDFLGYLEGLLTAPQLATFKEKCPVLFLVSKPKQAEAVLNQTRSKNVNANDPTPLQVVRAFLPLSYGRIMSWGVEPLVAMLYIGETAEIKDGEATRLTLSNPNYEHIGLIFRWFYTHFNDEDINKPPVLRRIWETFRKIFITQ